MCSYVANGNCPQTKAESEAAGFSPVREGASRHAVTPFQGDSRDAGKRELADPAGSIDRI
jgi:hypothetical protein